MLYELWDTMIRSFIRFFDNRFLPNTLLIEIEYLKLELAQEQLEKVKLLNYVLELNQPRVEQEIDMSSYKPLESKVSWPVRRKQLEKDDYDRSRESVENKKSIEQLEAELGITK